MERGPGAGEPYDVPAKLISHSGGGPRGLPSLVLGRPSCILIGKLRPLSGSCRPEVGPSWSLLSRRGPDRSLSSVSLSSQRWRKTWAVLYPASPHGVARLEFFDHKGSSSGGGRGGSRRLDCKVIRLAECVSVVPVSVESPPEPGAAAFRLDTAQRSHLLAADAPSSAAWVQTLCRNAFPVSGPGCPRGAGAKCTGP